MAASGDGHHDDEKVYAFFIFILIGAASVVVLCTAVACRKKIRKARDSEAQAPNANNENSATSPDNSSGVELENFGRPHLEIGPTLDHSGVEEPPAYDAINHSPIEEPHPPEPAVKRVLFAEKNSDKLL